MPKGKVCGGCTWTPDGPLVAVWVPFDKEKNKPGANFYYRARGGRLEKTEIEPPGFHNAFTGTFKGHRCLFVPRVLDDHSNRTDIYDLADLSSLGKLDFAADTTGDGGYFRVVRGNLEQELVRGGPESDWIRQAIPPDKQTYTAPDSLISIEVYDAAGKKVVTLVRDEIGKACFGDPRGTELGWTSADGSLILLAFGTGTIFRPHKTEYTFGVFDLKTGALVWKGDSNALRGEPVFSRDAIYALENKDRPTEKNHGTEVFLVRHTPKEGRKLILQVPLKAGETGGTYGRSPDGKTFVLQTEGAAGRLLLVPIGPDTKAGDIKEIPLPVPAPGGEKMK
jgi:hypothetical protein